MSIAICKKTFSILAFDLRSNAGFLLRHGRCVIITLTICTGNPKIRKSAFHKEIYEDCLGFSWWQKLEQKLSTAIATRRTAKISWFLIGIWEKLKNMFLSVSRLIATSWIHEAYHLLNLLNTPLQIHYRDMKVNNLSKSPSLALFFIWKLCWSFLLKVVITIFLLVCFLSQKESTCEKRKNIFTSLRKRSWDNQILTFQIFKCREVIKCPSMKHETNFTE